jgi:hypothetical protein
MKNCITPKNQATRRVLLTACATALAVAFTVSLPQSAHAEKVTPPPVPAGLEVSSDFEAFLVGHAIGTQNYVCQPSGGSFAFVLFTPQATLFDDADHQIITHFFSPNPDEDGTIRATWENSRDTSTVWAAVVPDGSAAVDPNSIAWLKLAVVGAEDGPTGGGKLSDTKFVQRLNTSGGLAPTTGCSSIADVGKKEFVPYQADYFFYKKAAGSDAGHNNRC